MFDPPQPDPFARYLDHQRELAEYQAKRQAERLLTLAPDTRTIAEQQRATAVEHGKATPAVLAARAASRKAPTYIVGGAVIDAAIATLRRALVGRRTTTEQTAELVQLIRTATEASR